MSAMGGGGNKQTTVFVVLNILVHILLLLIVIAIVAYCWVKYHRIVILQFGPEDLFVHLMSRAPQPLTSSEVA